MTNISVLWLTGPRLSRVPVLPSLLPMQLGVLQIISTSVAHLLLGHRLKPLYVQVAASIETSSRVILRLTLAALVTTRVTSGT